MSKKLSIGILLIFFVLTGCLFAQDESLEEMEKIEGDGYRENIPVKIVQKLNIPSGYHEGLFFDGKNIWINNGEKKNTWVVDVGSGEVISEISPVATFTEGITVSTGGKYWVTDWDTKKIYKVKIDGNKMVSLAEFSFDPARPTGVVWDGQRLFVTTWTRGLGTAYHLLEMDEEGNIFKQIKLKGIHEPSQLAWDGKNLWISSWYSARVYRIDTTTMKVIGHFQSPVTDTTGIVWDGRYMWLTGTHSDLYQMEIEE